jgi:hypothetical protein
MEGRWNTANMEGSMSRNSSGILASGVFTLALMVCASQQARSQSVKANYPKMAPLDQYLMERNAEIALARTAAPPSISQDADVLVLGQHSYESGARGTNGFVCIVQRSWTAGAEDPDFWNPKLRAPICFNPPAARSYVPIVIRKTELILAGKSKEQMFDGIRSDFDKKELPLPEPNSMCYMMSSQGYLSDAVGRWLPHLMFFVPLIDPKAWGAGIPGSPIIGFEDIDDRLTVFLIPVSKWSDGTPAPPM